VRIACLGGGPAGLYFAISMKLRDPSHEIVVIERNRANDTFGWGVVLSDETLENLARNDPKSAEAIRENFAYWDDIACRPQRRAHGLRRPRLLRHRPQEDADPAAGARPRTRRRPALRDRIRRRRGVPQGLRSRRCLRRYQLPDPHEYEDYFKPDIDIRKCKFVWLGTHQKFDDAFTFIFEKTEHGWVWAHAYQFDDDTATFIVECSQDTWTPSASARCPRKRPSRPAKRSSSRSSGGHELMSNAGHICAVRPG
jgi:anthraniloyl-CoA monooxygenase